jgi:O-antigen ligase
MPENQKSLTASAQIKVMAPDEGQSRLHSIIFVTLCTMLVFSVVAFGAVSSWALGASVLFSGFIIVLWLAEAWLKKEFTFNTSRLQLPILGLILIGLIQLLPIRSPDISNDLLSIPAVASLSLAPYATRMAVVQLIVYFIFFSAALRFINDKNRLRKTVLFVIIFGSVMAFFGILQRFVSVETIYGLRLTNQANPFGSFVNGHHFAAFMEMTLGVTLGLLFGKATKTNKRIFLIAAVVVMGMAIVFTSSRGGLLSLFGVIVFVVAANLLQKPTSENDSIVEDGKSYRRSLTFIGGGLALITILFVAVLLLGGDNALLRGFGLQNPNDPSNGRIHFWQTALQIFRDYPILGAGLDSFGTAFTQYDTWNGFYRVEQAHNDYLQTLADAGILGFACAAAFIFLLFKKGWQTIGESANHFRRSTAVGALAGCFGILLHSFVDFPLRTTSNALFFLTLAVLATASISQPKKSRRKRLTKTV